MFNIKWGGIAASAAFVLALALSLLLGQTSLLIALFRAVIFAALFFGLGIATWVLINTFIPELLSPIGTGDIATNLFSTENAGSRVNITVDDTQNAALPEQGGGDVGDFNELFTPKEDIDQTPATGYTEGGAGGEIEEFSIAPEGGLPAETEEFTSAFSDVGFNDEAGDGDGTEEEEKPGEFSMDFSAFVPGGLGGDSTGGEGGETDESDSDLDAFSFFPDGADTSALDEPQERKVSRNKPMKLEGDFNAKEIAAGLRTVLEKDKK